MSDSAKRDALVYPVAAAIALGWMASLAVALVYGQYAPLTAVTPLMVILSGYVFGSNIIKRAVSK